MIHHSGPFAILLPYYWASRVDITVAISNYRDHCRQSQLRADSIIANDGGMKNRVLEKIGKLQCKVYKFSNPE